MTGQPCPEDNYDRVNALGLRYVANDTCSVCEHCQSVKERCGHIVETCHHPSMDPEDEFPEVGDGVVCDWFKRKDYSVAKRAADGAVPAVSSEPPSA